MNNNYIIGSEMDPSKLQSVTIDMLRFPLALMVMFIHMDPTVVNLIDADFSLLSARGIFNVVGILLSHVITYVAVPTFFLISGYLFFANFQDWSWKGYRKKMNSRAKTLLIPYLLWNAVPFLIAIFFMLAYDLLNGNSFEEIQSFWAERGWHIFYDCREWETSTINWLGHNLRMTGPYDAPLWFLRDLIVVTALTPLIYYAIKKLGIFIICLLFLAYLSRIWTLLPGFHISAFFYFSTGSYFALNKINIVQFANKYKKIFIPICFIALVIVTIYDGIYTVIGQNVMPIFVSTGVFVAFYLASECIVRYNFKPNKLLISSCFFIYAFHGAVFPIIYSPLAFTLRVLHMIIPGSSDFEDAFCYIASPILAAFICILVLMLLRRLFPSLALYFSGNK